MSGIDDQTPSQDEYEDDMPFDEAMFKYFMESIVIGLKELIAFVKALPGFSDLSSEDQAALVKGEYNRGITEY